MSHVSHLAQHSRVSLRECVSVQCTQSAHLHLLLLRSSSPSSSQITSFLCTFQPAGDLHPLGVVKSERLTLSAAATRCSPLALEPAPSDLFRAVASSRGRRTCTSPLLTLFSVREDESQLLFRRHRNIDGMKRSPV